MLPSPRLLAAARILVGLTQEALAAAAGLSVSALKRLERGETSPNVRTLTKVRDALVERGVQFVFDPEGEFEGIRHRRPRPSSESPRSEPQRVRYRVPKL